jgi:heterodisulfide reductase subunit A2
MKEGRKSMPRIGVFVCECGPNIKDAIDIPELARFAGQIEHVVHVERVPLLCAPEGRDRIANEIRDHDITHTVFAACSPGEHEKTFRKILEAAGRNPFMMQTVNIREQCAWIIHDRDQATAKAKRLLRGALYRLRHHRPIPLREIDCCPDVLVVGAGVAGIAAARTLSQNDRRVFVVERSPCIGGMAALYEDLFPDANCAACLLEPDLDDVLHDDRITVLTSSEVLAVRGSPGNFKAAIKQAALRVDPERCIGCAACLEVCPVQVPNEFNAGMDTRKAIYIPYPGALPHVATIDPVNCLRCRDESCSACQEACPFEAIDYEAADTVREITAGMMVLATGFQGFDAARSRRYGYGKGDNVITAFAFERLVNTAGPTGGKILTADGREPDSVAFIHCVGSRTGEFNPYCSGICCMTAFKQALQVRNQLPTTAIHHFYADLCLPGKSAQRLFDKVAAVDGIEFHRLDRPDGIQIRAEGDRICIAPTHANGSDRCVKVRMVVLATAMEPGAETAQTSRIFDVSLDANGFFSPAHSVTDPVAATREGIYLAGCCQGPADIPSSVAQGQAAAGRILQKLVPGGKITLEPIIAVVDAELCSGCRTCAALCPFGALDMDTDEACMAVDEACCQGCGICVAACPSGAIGLRHYSREALKGELTGLLKSDGI